MDIVDRRKVPAGSLKYSMLFEYQGVVYMKCHLLLHEGLTTGINMSNGEDIEISDAQEVVPLIGTLIVNSIDAKVLDKVVEELEDSGAYEQEVNGYTDLSKGFNYCLSVINKCQEDINEETKYKSED